MTNSKSTLRDQLVSDEAELVRLQNEIVEIEQRIHPDFRDASSLLRLKEAVSAVETRIYQVRHHLARDPD